MNAIFLAMHPRVQTWLATAGAVLAATLGAPAALAQVPAGCTSATPQACLYTPAYNFQQEGVLDLRVPDPSRDNHPVPFRIRYPLNAGLLDGPRPVIVWNHGGSTTHDDPLLPGVTVGQQGSERRLGSFVKAGYVTIHVARLMPELPTLTHQMLLTCARAGQFTRDILDSAHPRLAAIQICRTFYGWHLWGPVNVAFVINWLRSNPAAMPPTVLAMMDLNRLAVGGWSGGGATALNIAGAEQRWPAPTQLPPRVVGLLRALSVPAGALQNLNLPDVVNSPVPLSGVAAFMDDAPRSPSWAHGTSGFGDESFYNIGSRPFLFTSGRFDTGGDNLGPNAAPELSRSMSWWQAKPGNKYLAWSPATANHSTMDVSPDGCDTVQREAYCKALENLGVAFMDAAMLQRPQAQQWLRSPALEVMTGSRIELHRR